LLAPPAAPDGDALELPGAAPAADPAPELEPLAPASDDPELPPGVLEDDEGDEGEADEEGEDGDADEDGDEGEAEGLALELPAPAPPAEPAEPEEPELLPPIEEPEAPLLPLAPAGESDPDLLHPAIAMVMTLAARTILVVLSIEFIVVPFRRIVYPSIQIPLTPSVSISFTKFGVASPRGETQELCQSLWQRSGTAGAVCLLSAPANYPEKYPVA
jgi:hypothetical protein